MMNRASYADLRSVAVGIGIISRGNHRNSRGPVNEWLYVLEMRFLGFPEDGRSAFWRELAVAQMAGLGRAEGHRGDKPS